MSTTNVGGQSIAWRYRNPITSPEYNKHLRDIIKPGISRGWGVSILSGNNIRISPGKVWFNCFFGIQKLAVSVETTANVDTLTLTSTNKYAYAIYNFQLATLNYADFKVGSAANILAETDPVIIIAMGLFSGPTLTGFDFGERTLTLYDADNNLVQVEGLKYASRTVIPTIGSTDTYIYKKSGRKFLQLVDGSTSSEYIFAPMRKGAIRGIGGVWSLTNNAGSFTFGDVPASGVIDDFGEMLCDGSVINDPGNTWDGKFVPNLTDDRILLGSTSGGVGGNTGNQVSLVEANLASHSHTGTALSGGGETIPVTTGTESANHTHTTTLPHYSGIGGTPFNIGGFAAGTSSHTSGNQSASHTHDLSVVTSNHTHTLDIDNTGSGTAFSILPKYLKVKYVIAVR